MIVIRAGRQAVGMVLEKSGCGHTQTFVGSECEHNDYIIIIIIMIGLPFAEFGRNAKEAKVIRLI